MLSEEEKKAIEWLKNKPDECTNIINSSSYIGNKKAYAKERANFKTVFNIITKLQKENEEKNTNIAKSNEYLERISQDLDNVAIDQIPIAIAELKYKKQLKDKQIDLMAEYIDEIDVSEVICGEKIICDENCKDCIKQYFETKAKGE